MLNEKFAQELNMILRANYIKKGGHIMAKLFADNSKIIDEVKKQKQDVIDKIKGIDSTLNLNPIPEKPKYVSDVTYLDEKKYDEQDIKDKAENSLSSYKNQNEFNIEKNYQNEKTKNEQNIEDTLKELASGEKDIKDLANKAKEEAKENSVSRGLGNSSIYSTKIDDIENEKTIALSEIKSQAESKVNDLKRKSADLERQRDTALANFEIEYAVKLQKEIDSLTNDITDYNNKIVEYNNKLKENEAKKKAEFDEKYKKEVERVEERNQEILKFLDKYGYGALNAQINKQKVDIVNEYLNTLDKQTALLVLMEDESFKNLIGEAEFNKILTQVKERKY